MSTKGTSGFIAQRATAVIIAPLAIWFLFSVVTILGADYLAARAWVANPVNAVLLGLFIIAGAWHMRLGMAEIIVDYIHSWMKDVLLLVNWLASLAVIAAALWSIYNISFAG